MYNQILVPLDGSKLAEGVLPYARLLARALQLPVDLLHVNDPETFPHPMQGTDYLKEVAASFTTSLTVSCCMEDGRVAEVIVVTENLLRLYAVWCLNYCGIHDIR